MFRAIIKWFIPSSSTLAGYAADAIAKSINDTDGDVKTKIAQYSLYANEVSEIAEKLSAMTLDGGISKDEAEEIKKMITPIFDKVLELI